MPPANLSPTVPPKEETRNVVIEPPPPPQPRKKQFITLHSGDYGKQKADQFELVWLTEDIALAYISARMILPLDVAIRQGIYPPKNTTAKNKVVAAATKVAEDLTGLDLDQSEVTTASPAKKSFLGNKLRAAVQTQKAKIDPNKLAAIKAGGK